MRESRSRFRSVDAFTPPLDLPLTAGLCLLRSQRAPAIGDIGQRDDMAYYNQQPQTYGQPAYAPQPSTSQLQTSGQPSDYVYCAPARALVLIVQSIATPTPSRSRSKRRRRRPSSRSSITTRRRLRRSSSDHRGETRTLPSHAADAPSSRSDWRPTRRRPRIASSDSWQRSVEQSHPSCDCDEHDSA